MGAEEKVLTWNQIGSISKPVAFLNVNGFFDHLFRFFDSALDAGLLMAGHRGMAQVADTVGDAVGIATSPAPESQSKWTDSFVTP